MSLEEITQIKCSLTINNSKVNIMRADIFAQTGCKIITFNEYFDTIVDNILIAHDSLNGDFIDNHLGDTTVEELDTIIAEQIKINKAIVKKEESRQLGKKDRCKLGSVISFKDYVLVAFSKFDSKNKATLKYDELHQSFREMWKGLDSTYAARPVFCPLIGSNILRIEGVFLEKQELLELLLSTYVKSKVRFSRGLNIVLTPKTAAEINYDELKKHER